MTNPMIKIVDAQTGEEIERPMTDAEFQAWDLGNKTYEQKQQEAAANKAAAEAKLEALGLSVDDLKALGL
jgi:hypothetical protein